MIGIVQMPAGSLRAAGALLGSPLPHDVDAARAAGWFLAT
jgi:hypothetical protein